MDGFSDPARQLSFRFSNPCSDLQHVYTQPPEVDDEMTFYIPSSQPAISRTIQLNNTFYEVWSPNSSTMDFYPGKPVERKELSYKFADGRIGPNDWSIHPQPFSSATPWWGFCRIGPLTASDWLAVDPELVPLPIIWQHSCSRPGFGRIDDSYVRSLNARASFLGTSVANYSYWGDRDDQVEHVLRDRPTYPSPDVMKRFSLGGYWVWQDAVILLAQIQRGLREMDAWLTMMTHWRRRGDRSSTIPMVNGDRLGVWLNGASEFEGLWLLRIGIIPVYVIHRYAAEIDFPIRSTTIYDRRLRPYFSNFIESTQAERLNSSHWNLYLKAFCSSKSAQTSTHGPRASLRLGSGADSCALSSSWAFRVMERACPPAVRDDVPDGGWGESVSWSNNPYKPLPPFWDPVPQPDPMAKVASLAAPLSNQKHGKMVCEGSISFWNPPPVVYGPESRQLAGKRRGKKKKKNKTTWISFYEVDTLDIPVLEGLTAMLLKSRRSGDDSDDDSDLECGPSTSYASRTYWDRHLGRRLVFLRPLARNENVHYDSSVFGIPIPDITFWSDSGNSTYKKCRTSTWAYLHPHPQSRMQVGLEPSLAECRPLSAPTSASPVLNSSASRSADALANDQGIDGNSGGKRKATQIHPIQGESCKRMKLLVSSSNLEKHNELSLHNPPPFSSRPSSPMVISGSDLVEKQELSSHSAPASPVSKPSSPMVISATPEVAVCVVPELELDEPIVQPQELCDHVQSKVDTSVPQPVEATIPVEQLLVGEISLGMGGRRPLELLELQAVLEDEEGLDWGVEIEGHPETETAQQEIEKGLDVMQIQASNPTPNSPACVDGIDIASINCVKNVSQDSVEKMPFSKDVGLILGDSSTLIDVDLLLGASSVLRHHAAEDMGYLDRGIGDVNDAGSVSVNLPVKVDPNVEEGEVVAVIGQCDEGPSSVKGRRVEGNTLGKSFPDETTASALVPLHDHLMTTSVTLTPIQSGLPLYPSCESRPPWQSMGSSQPMVTTAVRASALTLITPTLSLPKPAMIQTTPTTLPPMLTAPPLPAANLNTHYHSFHERLSQSACLSSKDRLSQVPPIGSKMASAFHERLSAQPSTSFHQPASQPGYQSVRKRTRGKKRGAKKTRGGIRGSLVKQFGKPFWDIVDNITDGEYATLSLAQQNYITSKLADRELEANQDDTDSDLDGV